MDKYFRLGQAAALAIFLWPCIILTFLTFKTSYSNRCSQNNTFGFYPIIFFTPILKTCLQKQNLWNLFDSLIDDYCWVWNCLVKCRSLFSSLMFANVQIVTCPTGCCIQIVPLYSCGANSCKAMSPRIGIVLIHEFMLLPPSLCHSF